MMPTRRGSRRDGFTMIELLIVLIIILTLTALSVTAVIRYQDVQQASNTRSTLSMLTQALQRRWNAVAEDALRIHPMPASAVGYVSQIAGTDPATQKVIWVKLRLLQEFPMTFDEAMNGPPTINNVAPPPDLGPLPAYQKYLNTSHINGSSSKNVDNTKFNNNFESSACLLMALQRSASGGGYNADQLGRSAVKSFPANGSSGPSAATQLVNVLVDGWGSPLAFYRWPAGSVELNPSGPQSGVTNDTTDSQGLLSSPSWQSNASYVSAFNTAFLYSPPAPGTSYKLKPLIVSPGSDKKLGLDHTLAAPISGSKDSGDNISNADM